jgi:rod shape-determining protein MreC
MDTRRDDVGISIRSALLDKGTKQKFSLIFLFIISIILILVETSETKPLNNVRSLFKDIVYRSSIVISSPLKGIASFSSFIKGHLILYTKYDQLKKENDQLKNNIKETNFLELENSQLRKLINEQVVSNSNLLSARVMLDKQSPYLNSYIINIGSNKNIKNGMAVLDGKNFVGRIVDVNFFSSRVLLVSDLNSKIPVLIEPSGYHAILNGRGQAEATLEYLPKEHNIKEGDIVYTSGKGRIFSPGIPVGKVTIIDNAPSVLLFSDLNQITFVNINLGSSKKNN